jgi:hypothetical protein
MNKEILKQLLVLNNLIIQSFIEEDEPEVEETVLTPKEVAELLTELSELRDAPGGIIKVEEPALTEEEEAMFKAFDQRRQYDNEFFEKGLLTVDKRRNRSLVVADISDRYDEDTASEFVGLDEYLAYRKLLNLPTE